MINQGEAEIAIQTKIDWVDKYATLTSFGKKVLDKTCSALVAIDIISYDVNGYGKFVAETMMDVNRDIAIRGIKLLAEANNKDFLIKGKL